MLPVIQMTSESRTFPIPDGLAGERVDVGLARLLGLSRTRVADLADAGAVYVDGLGVGKSHRLTPGSWISVELPPVAPPPPPQPVPGMTVHYEDADLLVIDKPAGVAAHASPGWTGPTVVGSLRAAGFHLADAGPEERKGIVHRLDADTSGVMIVAKSTPAYSNLKRAFKERTVTRRYHALVLGQITTQVGTIDAPIGRHPGQEYKMAVVAGGREARTHYEVLESYDGATLVKAELETGRTHQIRVHFQAIGHPCLGDPTYSPSDTSGLDRQWLHAVHISFEHPTTGEWIEFDSAYPPDLQEVLDSYARTMQ